MKESSRYKFSKVCIIGNGGWGTALAVYLVKKGVVVNLWGAFPEYSEQIAKSRYNSKFLPGVYIPKGINVIHDLKEAIGGSDLLIFAVPSKYAQAVIKRIRGSKIDLSKTSILSVTKGFYDNRLERISVLIQKGLHPAGVCVLSGPTIAMEVANGIPTSAVVASKNIALAKAVQTLFNSNTFRVYTSRDVIGVELGGALKNVIALACGVCDGLGLGTNTKAVIITRGLTEMTRLGKALGAKPATFSGLSGLGDLVTTSFSERSRNRKVGEKLAVQEVTIKEMLAEMDMVAEGVETVKSVMKLAKKYRVAMPISTEIYGLIYKRKRASAALINLMKRSPGNE